jgi:hypothetical protein
MGSGLQRICRGLGAIVIDGKKFVWDYVADKAVPEADMPFGSKRHAASERARAELIRSQVKQRGEQ